MSKIAERMQQSIDQKELVDIFRDWIDKNSLTGIITADDEEFLVIQRVTDDGEYDGIAVIDKEHITRFHWGGNERAAIRTLMEQNGQLPAVPTIDTTSIQTVIQSIADRFGYVTVRLEEASPDTCFIGEVIEVDDHSLLLNAFGTKDTLDRSTEMLRISMVTRVEADGKYERGLMRLFNQSQAK